MNSKTIFHELNHAAQFMLNKFEYRPYTSALQEVETRMILFYQVFLLANSEEIRKDRVKMVELLKTKYKGSSIEDLLPLTGDFYWGDDQESINSIAAYFTQNKIKYTKDAVYQIIYDWFSDNAQNNEVNKENFDKLMNHYAGWLTRRQGYEYNPTEFKPNYYLFDKLKK